MSAPAVEVPAPPGPDVRLLVPAMAAWAVTAATLSWSATRLATAAGGVVLLVALAETARRRLSRGGTGVVLLSLAAVAFTLTAAAGHGLAREAGPITQLAAASAVVTLEGTVATEPVTRPGAQGPMVMLTLTVTSVQGRGLVSRVRTPVLVVTDDAWQQVRWRERVRSTGRLSPGDPGDRVLAVFHPRAGPTSSASPSLVARAAEHLRSGLRRAAEPLPADARGLLPALVIGDTSGTPSDLTDAMLATGMTHLSAVSGSNVAVTLAAAMLVASGLGLPRRWRPAFALAVLVGFVVVARPEPSVIRAAAMGAIGLIGLSRSRRAAGIPVLSAAVLVLLAVDPWLARSFGFALSTLATLGLLLFTRPWGAAISRRLPARIASWGPALAIPVAAQAMCAPVVVLLQGSVSVVGVPANLLAAPLVAPATVCGVTAALVGAVWTPAATALCWLGALPTLGIAQVARRFAQVPGGTLPWPDGGFGAVLLAALTVGVLLTARWWVHLVRARPVLLAGVALLSVAAVAPTSAVTWPPEGWRLVACDVGQGDALVLSTTPGHAVLIDAGPEPVAVDGCLRRLGVGVLDAVVLTHLHADHVEGLPGALGGRSVREILTTPVREPPYEADRVSRWAAARGIPVRSVFAGDRLRWEGVEARAWWPARRIADGSVPNNASVVLEVHAGPVDALLMGDVEREAAHAMLLQLRRDPEMSAAATGFDVVKAPHHGSANLDTDLMATVRAPVGLISVGRDNDYGHPTAKALEVLRHNGYAVYRTDQRGDIAVLANRDEVGITWQRRH